MALIKWRDSYSVGVEKFDKQHKVLIELLNDIFIIVRENQSVDHLGPVLYKLVQYTQEHFRDEEKAMAAVNFPKLDEHKAKHGKLLNEVTTYQKRLEANDEKLIPEFYQFVREWLLEHILEDDMKYKLFLGTGSTTPSGNTSG